MAGPLGVIDTALYNALNISAITTLLGGTAKIYKSIATQGTALPYIIFQWQGGGEENVTQRDSVNVVYTVKALGTTLTVVDNIDAQIKLALHEKTLTVTGYTNYRTQREDAVDFVEVDEAGIVTYHRGAIYRILNSA
jgi:hypothetical protein